MSGQEILRNQKRRLGIIRHVEEVTQNVAKTCRYFGISRTAFYRWHERYQKYGKEGLKDRSRRPQHSPRATRAEIAAKIVYLRQHYHFGPWKIKMYLQRYHNIMVSSSEVWRILKRLNMNRLPYNQRYKRHETRWRRYEKNDQKTAIQFIDYVLSRLPFKTQVIQTDNGAEFQTQFHWHVLYKGINHVYIKPRRPRLNGKVERSHRIDEEEFYRMLDGVVIDDARLFNDKLREWEDFYNYNRPHAALDGQTPYERLRERMKLCV